MRQTSDITLIKGLSCQYQWHHEKVTQWLGLEQMLQSLSPGPLVIRSVWRCLQRLFSLTAFFFFNTLFKTFFLEKFKRPGWHIFTSGLLRWKNEGIFQTRMEMRLHRNLNFAKDQSWPKISKFLSVHTNILIVCLCVNKTNFCFPGVTLCKWISFLPAKDSEDKVKNQGHKQYSR